MEPVELLRRRKITRDTLFNYCYKENIKVPPKIDKPTLIREILKYWGSGDVTTEELQPVSRRSFNFA